MSAAGKTILPPPGDTIPSPPPADCLKPASAATRAAVDAIMAVAEAVRAAKEIPSGHLYAFVCGTLTLGDYQSIVEILKRAGLVEEKRNLLRWVGPGGAL